MPREPTRSDNVDKAGGAPGSEEGQIMQAFLLALAASFAIALGAAAILATQQRTSADVYSTESTRVGDPGGNLIAGSR